MNGFYWIASYPKSGNTWLRLFLHSLSIGGLIPDFTKSLDFVTHGATRPEFEAVLEFESGDLTNDEIARARPRQYEMEAASAATPLFRKVHDRWDVTPVGEPLFPLAVTLGVIYLVRDPRDVAVSFAYHNNASLDWVITAMANSRQPIDPGRRRLPQQLPQILGTWGGHVESWLDAPGLRRLVLRYEDMCVDAEGRFAEAADFLGLDASRTAIAAATEAVRFTALRDQEEAKGFRERPVYLKRFFRRGLAGGWRDTLSAAQVARIESDHGPVMRRLGYL
jgi:hypothetical protein